MLRFANTGSTVLHRIPQTKEDPSVAVFVWHTQTKTLTLIKEFAPGREEVAHGVVAGMYEKNKHDSPLQAAKFEVSEGSQMIYFAESKMVFD